VSRFSRRSRSTFFSSVEIFKIETFQSRLWRVKIVKTCQDFCRDCRDASRLSRFVEMHRDCQDAVKICREISTLSRPFESENDESLDGLRNLDKKIQKSTHLSIKIKTNCQETPKFSDLDEFLDLDRDFLVWTLMSRQNWEVSISTRISRLSRCTFWRCQDFLNCRDSLFDNVEIETLDWDHVKTNWDPQG
jgi:hypothetical protein